MYKMGAPNANPGSRRVSTAFELFRADPGGRWEYSDLKKAFSRSTFAKEKQGALADCGTEFGSEFAVILVKRIAISVVNGTERR